MKMNKVYEGDVLEKMAEIKSNSIDCIITSPPYWQLRDYGWSGQWGLEPTYQEYLDHLISFMAESKRVLKDTGTIWINLGDTYSNSGGQGNQHKQAKAFGNFSPHKVRDMPSKCLLLIPHRFATRCIDELDLILRNDIIWAKRNGMPESVTDRFSKKHEFFFFFAKSEKYYFDLNAIRDKHIYKDKDNLNLKGKQCKTNGIEKADSINWIGRKREDRYNPLGKNPGDVSDFWDIPTKPNSTKHYATFNSDLIDKPIIAGCPKNGIILDPFAGIGTTLARGYSLERNVIGIEGKKEYVDIANKDLDILKQQIRIIL